MPKKRKDNVIFAPNDPNASVTIPEFCELEKIGITFYYRMRKLGIGPVEHCPTGTKVVRISPEALKEWRLRYQTIEIEDNEVRTALRKKASEGGQLSGAVRRKKKLKAKSTLRQRAEVRA